MNRSATAFQQLAEEEVYRAPVEVQPTCKEKEGIRARMDEKEISETFIMFLFPLLLNCCWVSNNCNFVPVQLNRSRVLFCQIIVIVVVYLINGGCISIGIEMK